MACAHLSPGEASAKASKDATRRARTRCGSRLLSLPLQDRQRRGPGGVGRGQLGQEIGELVVPYLERRPARLGDLGLERLVIRVEFDAGVNGGIFLRCGQAIKAHPLLAQPGPLGYRVQLGRQVLHRLFSLVVAGVVPRPAGGVRRTTAGRFHGDPARIPGMAEARATARVAMR